jgi:succinate-acetate transporter protein
MYHTVKGWNYMEQYQNITPAPGPEPVRTELVVPNVASPAPLGLNVLAFVTALIGCFFTGFIIPYEAPGVRSGLAPMILVMGIVLGLAGMWEYRKNYMVAATIFTAYGGFLAALALTFWPSLGVISALSAGGNLHYVQGLFFLAWTIFNGVLFIGALRTNFSLGVTMIVLFVAYLLMTIGQLAGNNTVLNNIGGWLAIVAAIIAWIAALASIVSTTSVQGAFRLPLGRRLAVVE